MVEVLFPLDQDTREGTALVDGNLGADSSVLSQGRYCRKCQRQHGQRDDDGYNPLHVVFHSFPLNFFVVSRTSTRDCTGSMQVL